MQITLNGKPYLLDKPINLTQLSQDLQLEPTQFAIERNCEIVPRSLYEETLLSNGDVVEIVAFIGGG